MLTRLKVGNFKNLIDVDVRFGPFTCVAGGNGVGKSNLFDAIMFLSALADRSLLEAASSVRSDEGRPDDVRNLFHRIGNEYADQISLEVEMIIPNSGFDDLGQKANASITFLRYRVKLAFQPHNGLRALGSLELIEEELEHINLGAALENLLFRPSPSWRKSAIWGRRTSPFISTETVGTTRLIKLHQDGRSGRALTRTADHLPRTILSTANTAENPTVLLARREMQSWRLLQLEPAAMRRPDGFSALEAAARLGNDGSHLPATLFRLAHLQENNSPRSNLSSHAVQDHRDSAPNVSKVYGLVATRLAELIDDVYDVSIDPDEKRELLMLHATDRAGTRYPAKALSDGTLRFLALAVVELDPAAQGLICMEEPENGIHPARVPAMLRLLQDIAVDVNEPVGPDNPLRQVIINTHSPVVVGQVPEDSLLVAELRETIRDSKRFKRVAFAALPGTWRTKSPEVVEVVAKGTLLDYLNPHGPPEPEARARRVVDRDDLQLMLPFPASQAAGHE